MHRKVLPAKWWPFCTIWKMKKKSQTASTKNSTWALFTKDEANFIFVTSVHKGLQPQLACYKDHLINWGKKSKTDYCRESSRLWFSLLWADSRFVPSQWEMALLCNDVSHWLGANLESALITLASGSAIWTTHPWNMNDVFSFSQFNSLYG